MRRAKVVRMSVACWTLTVQLSQPASQRNSAQRVANNFGICDGLKPNVISLAMWSKYGMVFILPQTSGFMKSR